MTLADFKVGQIYATGPGYGLIGTKLDNEHVLDCLTGEVKYVPSCRCGDPLNLEVLDVLKKEMQWKDIIIARNEEKLTRQRIGCA